MGQPTFGPWSRPTKSAIVTFPRRKDLTPEVRKFVALHELGHVLGLAHDLNRDSVMFEDSYDRPAGIMPVDITRIRRVYLPLLINRIPDVSSRDR